MSIDTNNVAKIAKLARIKVTDEEKEHLAGEINGILQWVEKLSEVNTDDVPMLTSVSQATLPLRKDEVSDGHQQEAVLKNATGAEYGCFMVPKVVE